MKYLLLILFIILSHYYVTAQDECNPDIEAPTFELPMYLTEGVVYPCLDSVPPLTDMTDQAVMDLVFATLVDNCLSPDVAPWYGPTLSGGTLDITDSSITYTFTGYDDGPNYNTQQITFYFQESCTALDIIEYQEANFKVYPNPNNGSFHVETEYPYRILDLNGNRVNHIGVVPSGVYLIQSNGKTIKVIVK